VRNVSTRGLITLAIALASAGAPAFGFENTLASVPGQKFLEHCEALQAEAFGPVHLLVTDMIMPQLDGRGG